MRIRVATFNLNNLFSRYNFRGVVGGVPGEGAGGITLTFENNEFRARTFKGRLIKAKDPRDTREIARRITQAVRADVLAVQEVEHIEVLRQFNKKYLGGYYAYVGLIEGNDQRMIDVGVLSRLPLGMMVSHQQAVHPDDPGQPVFSRDLLQVEVLNESRKKLFTLYNTHLKSHYVPFGQAPEKGRLAANLRRRRQAEMIAKIIGKMERPDSRFVLLGDMNDPVDSPELVAFREIEGRALVNALANAEESRPAKPETPGQGAGPLSPVWTHRFNPPGPAEPQYELYDQIWLSDALKDRFSNPGIDRRTRHGGDGSDHDPAWVELTL
ncbi:MAG: endonuclease/exonuclease/phosphatase family protein [Thiotrichales bacterium]